MASCFHNENGGMLGLDLHNYLAQHPSGAPLPMLNAYVVGLSFRQRTRVKDQTRITIDGLASFQSMADWYFVTHIYIPFPPPHGTEGLLQGFLILSSSSKTWMGAHSVQLNGESAAICLKACISSNQNCAQPIAGISSNIVLNPSSVVTEPTWGDYIGSWVRMWLSAALSWAVGQGIRIGAEKLADLTKPVAHKGIRDLIQQILDGIGRHTNRRVKDIVNPDGDVVKTLLDLPKAISDWVQESVDRALEGDS